MQGEELQVPDTKRRRSWLTSSRLTDAQFSYLLIIPLVIVLLAIYAYPIGYTLWMSLHDIDIAFDSWYFVGLEQYARALSDGQVLHSLWITALYTVEVTVVTLVISLGAALLLNEQFYGKRLLLTVIIVPWALSTYATAVIWRYLYSQETGFFNAVLYLMGAIGDYIPFITERSALIAVAIAHSWQIVPLGVFFFLASMQVIPPDLYKAAKLDRLGAIGRFRYITFPYIRNSILVIMVLVSVEAARAYDVLYFLTGGGPGNASTTLTWQIYTTTFQGFDMGYGSALSYVLLVWIVIVTTFYFLALFGRGTE